MHIKVFRTFVMNKLLLICLLISHQFLYVSQKNVNNVEIKYYLENIYGTPSYNLVGCFVDSSGKQYMAKKVGFYATYTLAQRALEVVNSNNSLLPFFSKNKHV